MASKKDELKVFLDTILDLMGVTAEVSIEETKDGLQAELSGADISLLIGSHGKTLNSLQCLVSMAINHGQEDWTRVVIDAAGYRERRRESLESCALRTAEQALEERREISLEPMNSFERRIIHCALMGREDVRTDSRGDEPHRFVVIGPAVLEED